MTDREILRDLAKQYAEIAFSPENDEKRKNWGRLLALDNTARPTIMIDQLPGGHELNGSGELNCYCTDPWARGVEGGLRFQLFRYKHFKADMVFTPFLQFGKSFSDTGYGIQNRNTDETGHSGAQTHLYEDMIPDDEALDKLHKCTVTYNAEATKANQDRYDDMFGDIIPSRPQGTMIWAAIWDRIVFARGAEKVLYSLYDDSEYLHRLMRRLVDFEMDRIDQLEAQNLLCAGPGAMCHCTETYVDEPKWYAIDQNNIKASDCWISGAAQIFSEVSPAMHDEFEIEYLKPLYDRFGWVNYGCCDPLDRKIDIVRKFNTVRAISCSPWSNVDMQSEAMGKDFVMARKPNPAYVASGYVDDAARKEVRHTLEVCRDNGTPVMFILKDITTINSRVECLTEWNEMVKAEIENF